MIAPRRLLETDGALPPELRKALHGAPGAPHPDELQSLAASLGPALGLTLSAPTVVPAVMGAKAASIAGAAANQGLWAVGSWLSWLLGGVAIGASVCGLAVYVPALGRKPELAPQASARAATSAATGATKRAVQQVNAEESGASGAPVASSPGDAVPPHRGTEAAESPITAAVDARESEISLLRRAQQAVTRYPSEALAFSALHAQRFPNGVFVQEREVIAIDSLLRLGRIPEARARARAFNESYPTSAHARRIQALLDEHSR